MIITELLLSFVFLMSGMPDEEMSLPVLISEKVISKDEYQIVCRGYPKSGLSGVARESSAKEAALINAQTIAASRFSGIDAIKTGEARKYSFDDAGAIVEYVVHYPDITKYLKSANGL